MTPRGCKQNAVFFGNLGGAQDGSKMVQDASKSISKRTPKMDANFLPLGSGLGRYRFVLGTISVSNNVDFSFVFSRFFYDFSLLFRSMEKLENALFFQ